MAREMYLAGVSKEELQPPPPPKKPETPKEKWDNFWYHYKWWVVAAVFAAAVLGVLIGQMVTAVHPDYVVALVTKDTVGEDALQSLTVSLQTCGEDQNGDGKVIVQVENLALGQFVGGKAIDLAQMNNTKLVTYLMTGDIMLYIFDDTCYRMRVEELMEAGGRFFDTLSVDDDGVDSETGYWNWNGSVYQQSDWGKTLPDDLYFGVRQMGGTASGRDAQQKHDAGKKLFETFVQNMTA